MEQFNLDKYLENPNRKIVTRDGRKVRIICTDLKIIHCPVIALISDKESSKEQCVICSSSQGRYYPIVFCDSELDLFFAPIKKEGWINVCYSRGKTRTFVSNQIYATKEEAQKDNNIIIETLKIEWEE